MRAAGVERIGSAIEPLELPEPGPPRAGEVLIEVRASGVGNWDEFARPELTNASADRDDQPGRLHAECHRRPGAGIPAAGPDELVPVTHPAGPHLEQHLAGPRRSRLWQLQQS